MTDTWRTIRGWHPPLIFFTVLMLVLFVASAVGLVVDGRVINGAPAWLKALKFSMSFAIYAATMAWFISLVPRPRWRRVAWWAGTVVAVASTLEVGAITLQVVRGQMSHFNNTSAFNTLVFNSMGAFVATIFLGALVVGGVLARFSLGDRAFTWAVRFGVVISIAGLSVGFLMLLPTPDQVALGDASPYTGAHAVGVPDGGAGLPVLGWSTTGGDLRIGHFIGMHALQALPLLAAVLAVPRLRGLLSDRGRLQVVVVAGVVYAGVVALTVWQALRAQPLLQPDALTLTAAAVLLAVATVGAGVIATTGRPRPTPADARPPAPLTPVG